MPLAHGGGRRVTDRRGKVTVQIRSRTSGTSGPRANTNAVCGSRLDPRHGEGPGTTAPGPSLTRRHFSVADALHTSPVPLLNALMTKVSDRSGLAG